MCKFSGKLCHVWMDFQASHILSHSWWIRSYTIHCLDIWTSM